jgi:hypothetical protein
MPKLFASYPPPVRDTALTLRKLIFDTLGKPEETLNRSARLVGYGFGLGYKGTVCVIIPSKQGVKLDPAYGADLPDPKGLLAGAGNVHRHIAFKSADELKRAGVKPLLKATFAAWKVRASE